MKRTILLAAALCALATPARADVRITNATRVTVVVRIEFMGPQGKVTSTTTQSLASDETATLAGHADAADHQVKIHLSAGSDDKVQPGVDDHPYDIRYDKQGHIVLFDPIH